MSNKRCLFFLFFVMAVKISAQVISDDKASFKAMSDTSFTTDSKIKVNSATEIQTRNLALLCKIWGFLKYHHPQVMAGDYNWDFELFRIMPKILSASNNSNRDKILLEWIDSLGAINSKKTSNCQPESDAKQKPDFSWIDPKNISSGLVDKLMLIKNNPRNKNSYYVNAGNVGEPNFTHENAYPKCTSYPDDGYRLLGLFRFWNIIEYYYPYKYAIKEEVWDDVIARLIPKFIEAKNAREYRVAILMMFTSAHDSHIVLYQDPVGRGVRNKSCATFTFIENNPVVSDFTTLERSKESQLRVGDIILEKNDVAAKQLVELMLSYTPASNKPTQLRNIKSQLLATNEASIKLKISRNDSILEVVEPTPCKFIHMEPKTPSCNYSSISKDVGYVYMGNIKVNQLPETFKYFAQTKGIILDIRNYPADFMVLYEMSKYLVARETPFVRISKPTYECPGMYKYSESLKVGKRNLDYYKGKIVILVNEETQSRAEFFAMAFQTAPRAIVMGSQTAGADGNFATFSLPGGFASGISGLGIYYPDGRETQRIGIVPDIEVKPTIKGIKEGRDEVLERAITYIEKN